MLTYPVTRGNVLNVSQRDQHQGDTMNPFTTQVRADDATDAQIQFIATMLGGRNLSGLTPAYARRIQEIRMAIDSVESTDYADGHRGNMVNRHLDRPLTKAGASKLIELLKGLPGTVVIDLPDVPAGRYALETTTEDATNTVAFYRVDRPTEGKWAGRTFLKLLRSDDEVAVRGASAKAILDRIAADPEAASKRFGQEIGECGVCGRTLTNDASREAGIGPKCQETMGW
ncbi:hypothetical protein HOT45_gp54 [Gordonia phage Trine]|uniref:Uncharacterized protein n=1 Tax=Gordonia phage Trine TaxID=2201431 RepID=A0A2Z4Q9I9_9CAUD|nr:hypothetical protein HOT45_gp54 [Gordonia phage Trine]AWY06555.1 hypothetical protein PBI_TRINE_54 [Gordonia phage Trine]